MPIKKGKKGKKKKKAKEKKDDDDEEKPIIDIPEYKDPDIYTPKATLKICLATPITQKLSKYLLSLIFVDSDPFSLYSFYKGSYDLG